MNQKNNIRQYKSTNAEIEVRINNITMMILQGYTRPVIAHYTAKNFGLRRRQIDAYISKSKNKIMEISASTKEESVALAVARFEDLYQKAYKDKDWGLCQSIQGSLNKLLGLNAESRTRITITGSISPEKWLEDNAE